MLNLVIFIVNHVKKYPPHLEKALLLFSLGVGIISICFVFGVGTESNSGRITWLGAGANGLAIKFLAGFVIILIAILEKNSLLKKSKWLFALFIPFIFQAMLLTSARLPVLALLLIVLMYGFFKIKLAVNFKRNLLIMIAVLIIMLFFILQSDVLMSRLLKISGEGDWGSEGRFFIWEGVISIIQGSVIFGYGLSGYEYQSYRTFGLIWSPHNIILELLVYTGVIGLALFSVFAFRVYRAAYYLYKFTGKLLPFFLIFIVFVVAMSTQVLTEKVTWLFMAYVCASYLYHRRLGDIPQGI